MLALAALLAAGALCAAQARATSVEGGNAFNELAQKAQEETTSTATTTTSSTGSTSEPKNTDRTIFIGIGAAAVLLLAIAFVIVRDARRVAPVGPEDVSDGRSGNDPKVRRQKQRAKARAARQQRKKNR